MKKDPIYTALLADGEKRLIHAQNAEAEANGVDSNQEPKGELSPGLLDWFHGRLQGECSDRPSPYNLYGQSIRP